MKLIIVTAIQDTVVYPKVAGSNLNWGDFSIEIIPYSVRENSIQGLGYYSIRE